MDLLDYWKPNRLLERAEGIGFIKTNDDYETQILRLAFYLLNKEKFLINVSIDTELYFKDGSFRTDLELKWSVETRIDYILQWNCIYNQLDSSLEAYEYGVNIGLLSLGV